MPTIESWDETYVHTKHNPVDRTVLEVRRENGHDEPWTWVRTYGKGRVFYTAWGHDQRTWGNAGIPAARRTGDSMDHRRLGADADRARSGHEAA